MTGSLTFRIDSLADPAKRVAWLDLLRDMFGLDLAAFSRLGIWPDGYRAFSWMDGEVIAANISCRPLPILLNGRQVAAGQLHAVATRPRYRRRGLFNDLMRRVLDYCDARFECVLLYTVVPALYAPFGFRHLPEHRFRGRLEIAAGTSAAGPARPLSLTRPAELAILRSLFAKRQPVSRRLGLLGNEDVFIVNALARPDWRLDLLPNGEALVVWQRAEGITRLHDIVARRPPETAAIAAALGIGEHSEIEVLFPPDELAGSFSAVPHAATDDERVMVRGPFDTGGEPVMLPLTAVS